MSQQSWAEKWGAVPVLGWGANTMWSGSRPYLHAKCHLDPSSRLAIINMGRKLGAMPPFWEGGLGGHHLAQCRLGRGLPPCQVPSWFIQQIPQFSTHVYCAQMAGWIKMSLGTEVDLGPDDILLDGNPACPKGAQHPQILAHVLWPKGMDGSRCHLIRR